MTIAPASTRTDISPLLAIIYRPLIRGYFGAAAFYYVVFTLIHIMGHSGAELPTIIIASITASLVFGFSWYALRNAIPITSLHAVIIIANLSMFANVMIGIQAEFAPEKLVYFIIMAMLFALAYASIPQALVSIAAVLAGLFYVLLKHAPENLEVYGFITFAVSLSAMTINLTLRRAIGQIILAGFEAENRLKETKKLSEKMRQRSLSDSLTGLPNRRAFFETLKRSKNEAGSGHSAWLVLLDLDGFKAVNDGYGHLIGDKLLKAVVTRMQDYCGAEVHLSRMGGDEFNIILPGLAEESAVESWCQRLLDHVAEVYLIEDRLIQISASIGCHEIISTANDVQLVRDADYALLYAKKHGKNKVVVFQDKHAKVAAEHFRIEQALRAADFDSEIELLFQPQIDLTQNRIVRAEALARWSSPIIGDIMPGCFIEVAEESGLIANITLAVLKQAIAALKNWPDPIPLSINLSGHDLISDPIINQIIDQVKASGLNPALLEFEVTETAMMVDTSKASSNMLRLSALGHPLALDDFGTGYSNFNYLRTLPISKLKVDRSFMKNVADPMTEKILQSLVGMARTLGVDCLLEGVEDELQLLVAKRVGTHMVQGYLFGMPMTAMELLSHLEEQNMVEERHIKRLVVGG
jgi:diguanylate cyclase (GGDEF)-like protein